MAETSGFFDSVYDESTGSYDLEYFAEQFAKYFSLFVGNGVFGNPTNQLRVLSAGGMNVKILAGFAFINGYWYRNDEEIILQVPQNLSGTPRNDTIICRWDNAERKISVVYQVASTDITRDDSYYDLKLATISVPPRVSIVEDSYITDERPKESVCGFVTGVVKTETTEDLFAQYDSLFSDWFEEVKDQLSGDLALRLQQEFLQIQAEFENTKSVAANALSEITEFVSKDFVIPIQELSFNNNTCEINDDRVTENSLVDVYFTSDTMSEAESAIITVDSLDKKIILISEIQPTKALKALIRVRVM